MWCCLLLSMGALVSQPLVHWQSLYACQALALACTEGFVWCTNVWNACSNVRVGTGLRLSACSDWCWLPRRLVSPLSLLLLLHATYCPQQKSLQLLLLHTCAWSLMLRVRGLFGLVNILLCGLSGHRATNTSLVGCIRLW